VTAAPLPGRPVPAPPAASAPERTARPATPDSVASLYDTGEAQVYGHKELSSLPSPVRTPVHAAAQPPRTDRPAQPVRQDTGEVTRTKTIYRESDTAEIPKKKKGFLE